MFIALEGADGTGKTTLCGLLAERLGATARATPPKAHMQHRELVDRDACAEDHYQFYRGGIHLASQEIAEMLERKQGVVIDRYWLTTFTYHQLRGVPVSRDDFKDIVMPTLTVILALNCDIQVARMRERGLSVGDRQSLDKQQEIALAFYQNALAFSLPFVVLDTQRFSPAACVEMVANIVEIMKE